MSSKRKETIEYYIALGLSPSKALRHRLEQCHCANEDDREEVEALIWWLESTEYDRGYGDGLEDGV